MRQIALDTETTGLSVKDGHRIIEIGCIEILNRRVTNKYYHQFLQPDRKSDTEALAVHGITHEFLKDKPRFREIVNDFMNFIKGAELLIHNAAFDMSFINRELELLHQDWQPLENYCKITDTFALAKERHPGQKNNLDALCKRYGVDNSNRQLHGALLDAEILAEVYLTMTAEQVSLLASEGNNLEFLKNNTIKRISSKRASLSLITPTEEELQAHKQRLTAINKACDGKCLWLNLEMENRE